MLRVSTSVDGLTHGNRRVTSFIMGDIRPGSLVLFNGESGTGKSVFCQQLSYNALYSDASSVAYFTSDRKPDELMDQMESFSFHVQFYFVSDKFRIYSLELLNKNRSLDEAIRQLLNCLRGLPPSFTLSVIDNINPLLSNIDAEKLTRVLSEINFFCKDTSRSVIIVTNPYIFPKKSLSRVYTLCDYYLQTSIVSTAFGGEHTDGRIMRTLEVKKIGGIEMSATETVPFEIRTRTGIHLLPYVTVKA